MPQISNIKKFFIARTFSSMYFWAGISIPYLIFRGLTVQQAVTTIAIYAISNVILEYPTGVIGDYFGHKLSIALGGIFFFIGFILMAQSWPHYIFYYIASFINAIGDSLESGSDEALLHSITTKFEDQLGNYKGLKGILKLISTTIAGIIASINLPLTVILTALANLFAAFIIVSIKTNKEVENSNLEFKGNIFNKATEGIHYVKSTKGLFLLIIFVSIVFGYNLSLKTILGTFDEIFNIDIKYIGLMIGMNYFIGSLGYKLEKHSKFIKTQFLVLMTLISFGLILLTNNPIYIFSLLIFGIFINGFIVMRIKIQLHEMINNSIRASVISLHNLLARLLSSTYLFLAGYILDLLSFNWLIYLTILIFVVASSIFLLRNSAKKS